MRRQKELEIKISSLEFIVTPIKISGRHLQGGKYFIEFDKGAQVLKKFDQEVVIGVEGRDYQFIAKENGKFKLQSQRNSACEWAVYRVEAEEMSEFVDSMPTNLHQCFVKYSESIKRRSIEYQHILSEKSQAREIWRQWEVLKEGLSWQFLNLTAKNKSGDIEMTFRVEIRCELDVVSEQQRRKNSIKSMKSIVQQDKSTKKEVQDADDLISRNSKPLQEPPKPKIAQQQPILEQNSFDGYRISQSPPFIEPSVRKQQSVLSDIIERSNQCSSRNKESKKGELKDITDIPEEQSQLHSPYSPLPNTKTQHFDAKFQRSESEAFKKRSNTFDSNKNPTMEEGEISISTNENKKISLQQPQLSYDQQLQREQLVELLEANPPTQSPPSQNETVQHQTSQHSNKPGNFKGLIAVIILLVVIGFAAYSQRSLLLPQQPPKPKKQKAKKEEVRKKPKKQNKQK